VTSIAGHLPQSCLARTFHNYKPWIISVMEMFP
jgi:hypothetical protein